jgi:hypothetical protein
MEPHPYVARHHSQGGGVEARTHEIIHLENHVETQDAELEERAERIADLEQQLLELQGQAPPDPTGPEEIDAMSGIDED